MRRAMSRLVLLALGLSLLLPVGGEAARDDIIDGTMMVDYSKPPSFRIGSWVRYHTVGSSLLGLRRNYTLTLLIAGEEDVWGDRCFWLETCTQREGMTPDYTASLISYSAFGDTAALSHAMWFIRKMVTGPSGKPGEPEFSLWTRDREEVRQRSSELRKRDPMLFRGTTFDTLGVDTVMLPRGTYRGAVVRERSRIQLETMYGDSTHHDERVETRTRNMSDDVPITHLVREQVHDVQKRKRWLLGRSADAVEQLLEEGTMRTVLIDYGEGDLTPAVIPPRLRVSVEEQRAARERAAPATSRKRGD